MDRTGRPPEISRPGAIRGTPGLRDGARTPTDPLAGTREPGGSARDAVGVSNPGGR